MDLRIVLGCAVAGALLAGGLAAAGERDYRARAFVIRVPPDYGNEAGLRLVRSDPVLRRALALARVGSRDPRWLRERSSVQLTSRLDFAITVETPDRLAAAALATAYAKAIRRSLRTEPGLVTRGRGARAAEPMLGPFGWSVLGATAGLFAGAALAILRSGSARGSRRASPPYPRGSRATRD